MRSDARAIPALAIGVIVAVVFWRATTLGFVNFDDTIYVTQNPVVQSGLNARTFVWACTAVVGAQRYPLTLLSHLLDVSIFGLNPSGHHATSVLIHAANAGLLYLALVRLAGRQGAAMAVSLLWALHPLRVESVAWVAERKDVLSGFFWMLGLLAYSRYVERPGVGRYAQVFLAAAAGLLCKPMAVTLPGVLLLLDVWPLGRFAGVDLRRRGAVLVAEKLPLIGLSLAASLTTMLTQSRGGAVATLGAAPLPARVLNAIGSVWVYFAQTLVPVRLSVFYPMPERSWLYVNAAAGLVLLIGASAGAYALRRRIPAVGVGWLWFVGSLAPVIGIVQVGAQAHADRYTYIPQVGLLIAEVWLAMEVPGLGRGRVRVGVVGVVCAGLAALTWIQAGHWRSSESLFEHALLVTSDNARAHDYYGQALAERGDLSGAIGHLEESIRLEPGNPQPRQNLSVALGRAGDDSAAVGVATRTLELFPKHVGSLILVGLQALKEGRVDQAVGYFERAAALAPERAEVRVNLGICYGRLGRRREAEKEFLAAVAADARYAPAYLNLGVLARDEGDADGARKYFERALEAQADYASARTALEQLKGAGH